MFSRISFVTAALAFAASLNPAGSSAQQRPDLVVVIAVDQMRGDYLDRYAAQLNKGLGIIRKESVYFPNGLQNHALTETAPGHASILSGRYPAHTGIFANEFGVPDRLSPLVGVTGNAATSAGASPARFNGTQLYDWMLARDSSARVLSISRKDRGAILMTGKARADVFWWSPSAGKFTTSTYYRTALPDWINEFNSELKPSDWAGKVWTLLRAESDYPEADDVSFEAGRPRVFPHALPDSTRVMARLETFPWMDSLIAVGALRGVNALQLGKRGTTDLLNVSFSTTDAIGHEYGPDSREIHDHMLRLDGYIGFFLDSLWKIVPRARTIVAFTSDHGVNPFPEIAVQKGQPGGKISMSDVTRALTQRYNNRYRVNFDFSVNNSSILAEVAALRERGIDVDSLAEWAARMIMQKTGVERVFTPASLKAAPASDSAAMLWRRQIPDGFQWLTLGVAKPGYQFNSGGQADHGTFSAHSRSVPIAFLVPGLAPRTVTRTIETVDIGPTLAALLGISPTQAVDGKVAAEVRW